MTLTPENPTSPQTTTTLDFTQIMTSKPTTTPKPETQGLLATEDRDHLVDEIFLWVKSLPFLTKIMMVLAIVNVGLLLRVGLLHRLGLLRRNGTFCEFWRIIRQSCSRQSIKMARTKRPFFAAARVK